MADEATPAENTPAPAAAEAAPAPAAAPVETPAPAAAADDSDSTHPEVPEGTGFDDLLDEPQDDDDDEVAETPAAVKPAQKGEEKPAAPATPATPAATPTAEAKPAVPAAPDPAVAPVPAQPTTPATPAAQTPPAEAPVVDTAKLRSDTVNELASKYTFTPEEVELLHEEPEKVLGKLAAEVTVSAYEAVSRTILGHLPSLVQHITQSTRQMEEAERHFFQTYPALNKPEYKDTLLNVSKIYRQMNPDKSYDEAAPMIASLVAAQLKLQLEGAAPSAAAAAPAPAEAPRPTAHTPALPGAGGPAPNAGPTNPFDELTREFEEID